MTMEALYHQTNRLFQETQDFFGRLERTHNDDDIQKLMREIQARLEQLWSNCERLDMLASKEPVARRQNAKLRVDQLKYDIQHLNAALQDYWYVLVPVHVATSIVWYGSFYMMCKSGIDMVGVLESLGTSEKILNPLRNSDAGYYALAYACYKIATPFRYTVTVGGTGYTIQYLSKQGILKAGDVKESAMEKASDLKENYEDFKEKAIDAKESAMEKATDLKERAIDAKESAMEKATDLKERASDFKENYLGGDEAREKLSKIKKKFTIKYKNR